MLNKKHYCHDLHSGRGVSEVYRLNENTIYVLFRFIIYILGGGGGGGIFIPQSINGWPVLPTLMRSNEDIWRMTIMDP